ncbi:hypothetical protein ACDQ55_10985 [Chitinophaga sp. 30R24]|uniref:hypothetical protein n=1 Tax=Chitinophaga sp. 30R24 TaxID=3248838 RepID=UPI003B91B294
MSGKKTEMILLLQAENYAVLGTVRHLPGLCAALDDQQLWLRGIPWPEKPDPLIQQLPAMHTYLLDKENRLFPLNGLTPVNTLKQLSWKPLPELLPITLPISAMPAALPNCLPLRLQPCLQPQSSYALLTTWQTWYNYGTTAAEARLKALSFAAAADHKVLIIGHPLPPIPGKEYILQHQLLLPAGYSFDPAGIAPIVSAHLNPAGQDLLLFDTTGAWERIPQTAFVTASRSAIRLTQKELDNG